MLTADFLTNDPSEACKKINVYIILKLDKHVEMTPWRPKFIRFKFHMHLFIY
ncbi:hypothetical protein LOK49_LG08G01150 [Camellia lanceoleosa]|uniref:Uncharacterized protein n=1 Tax=Camellia lanceoleosa TaxID=1840588 RepID=A0ACC0GSH8_9ERIC|nr:hypothetical protein LOK49_LG08G01150 [Camellia lanceoleosa]